MKKIIISVCCMILVLCGCADVLDRKNEVPKLKIETVTSYYFSEKDINQAIKSVERYFTKEFNGCYLTTIRYAGDETLEACRNAAHEYNVQQAIILISSFYVTKHGGDGSLNQDYTYEGWKWILTQDDDGRWTVQDYGYA